MRNGKYYYWHVKKLSTREAAANFPQLFTVYSCCADYQKREVLVKESKVYDGLPFDHIK